MALTLPRVHVLADKQLLTSSRHNLLDGKEEARLLALEAYRSDRPEAAGDRIVPLDNHRFAVGRGVQDGAIWRIVEHGALERAAWLWTSDAWFLDDVGEQAPDPRVLPLRELLARTLPLAGSAERVYKTIGASIGALRRGEKVAVLAPAAALRSPIHSGRWFALALTLCLPDDLAPKLAMSCWEPAPLAEDWDLVVVSQAPEGFTIIDASAPPEVGDDPVALFVIDRLGADDPETLEASSELPDVGLEMWTGAFEAVSVSSDFEGVDPELYEANPSLAAWVLIGKLDEGVAMTDSFAEEIAQATAKVGDPRIWEVCSERSTRERIKALSAFLALEPLPTPSDELLRALARARPPGRVVAPWANALLTWMRAGVEPSLTESLLLETVVEDDPVFDPVSRAAVYSELMIGLIEAGRHGEVLGHLFGPTAHTLLDTIGAGPLVVAWLHLEKERRTLSALQQLVELIAGAPDGDRAAARLYRGLMVQGEEKRAEMVVHQWARTSLRLPQRSRDRLLEELKGTDNAVEWVQVIAAEAPQGRVSALVRGVARSRGDAIWSVALNERAVRRAKSERERLLLVRDLLPDGDEALEPEARELFATAMPDLAWPDPEIATLAASLAEVSTATPLWMWVAITGATPDQFPDDTVEATIDAFMAAPPHIEFEREASLRCTAGLAHAGGWSPFEHARWLVRLIMAPNDGREFHLIHAQRFIFALTERGDGPERIAEITNAFVELPPEHPALLVFLHRLLPGLFGGKAPDIYVSRVDQRRMDRRIRTIWKESVAMQRNPLGLFRR
ncbi:MAG: hypothetical protein EP330_19540 [Deltaproteobacteria bacterium]|nr:MAG: hypothetical protein EP330_19540 [Deltaproteobacteria bacterium]